MKTLLHTTRKEMEKDIKCMDIKNLRFYACKYGRKREKVWNYVELFEREI
jgi:hypothetical protein